MSSADWIKIRKKLWDDGRVRKMSRLLRTERGHVIGALVRMWCLADDYADENGYLSGYTKTDIDNEVGVPGWCEALPPDWFREDDNGLYLPDYQEHNGQTAKRRAEDAKRKIRVRKVSAKCPQNVRKTSDKMRTREEKRRIYRTNGIATPENRKRFVSEIADAFQLTPSGRTRQSPSIRAVFEKAVRAVRSSDEDGEEKTRELLNGLVRAAHEAQVAEHIENPIAAWQAQASRMIEEVQG